MTVIVFKDQDSLWADALVHKLKDMDRVNRCGKLHSKADSITESELLAREGGPEDSGVQITPRGS